MTVLVGETAEMVPVHNTTSKHAILEANQTLTRRAAISKLPVIKEHDFPLAKPLRYEEIKRPDAFNMAEPQEFLDFQNRHCRCFTLALTELCCTDVGQMVLSLKEERHSYVAKPYRVTKEE